MKKIIRILSVALVAAMVLSLSAAALADTPSVYIPKRLGKLVDAVVDDFVFPTLKTHTTSLAVVKDAAGNVVYSEYCKDPGEEGGYAKVRSITEDSVMQFQFSEKPDWFGCSVSTLDYPGGWASIDIDDSGYGELEVGELHRQPGTWFATGDWYDADGRHVWTATGGDNIFIAGKAYEGYSVEVTYRRNGDVEKVVVTLNDSEDFFRTNQEGGVMSITFEKVKVETDCGSTNVWYVAGVSATYPEGNPIVGVDTEWRNDKKQNLATYRISYAVSENEVYKITYAPNTATILQEDGEFTATSDVCYNYLPSQKLDDGVYLIHLTADEPIYGEYYRNGTKTAVSGSGNKLNKWYKPGHGAQVKSVKKGTTSFKSPRVY